ncbi:MAG: hypothetical protein MSQ05_03080 [Akkermansia sp.]|nr:hypothetical protein [Akkermansia sp.]
MKHFLLLLVSLVLCTLSAGGVEIKNIGVKLTRNSADKKLTPDYSFKVLEDLSVRRTWYLSGGRILSADFDAKSQEGKLISAHVVYEKPVDMKTAQADALALGHTKSDTWKKLKAKKAEELGLAPCKYKKLKNGSYLYVEMNAAKKATSVSLYAAKPSRHRLTLGEWTGGVTRTALGSTADNSGSVNFLKQDEEKRLAANKKRAAERPRPSADKPARSEEVVVTEVIEEVEDETDEAEGDGDAEVTVVKTEKGPWPVIRDYCKELSSRPWTTMERLCIYGGGGLILLLIIVSAVRRRMRRKAAEERAQAIMNGKKS